jgi:ferritin-like metal-binding protein YciE
MANPDLDTLITWLRDAYAFEKKLVPELQQHAAQAEAYPSIQQRLRQHAHETEQHAAKVKRILEEELGSDVSSVKTIAGQMLGWMMGASTALAGDTMVKNALAEYTMEHTEIASYTSLITASEHLALPRVAQALRGILQEEEAMAEWLKHQIGHVTLEYLRQEAAAPAQAA